jgi:hypothetical protein
MRLASDNRILEWLDHQVNVAFITTMVLMVVNDSE